MSEHVKDRANTPEGQAAIRQEVLAELEGKTSRKQLEPFLQEMDLGFSTLTAWLGDAYGGNDINVGLKLDRWLDMRRQRRRTLAIAPRRPDFQLTASAQSYWGVLQHAQFTPDMVSIINAPGTGKTSTIVEYQKQNPNVWVMTGQPSFHSSRALLLDLAETLDIEEQSSAHGLTRAIQKRLRGTAGLLIVDEAQHYHSEAHDQLRSFHDACKIGIAVVGNDTVQKRLEGGRKAAEFAQLFSRIGYRLKRDAAKRQDIDMLLDAWGIQGREERTELHGIARRPGALRSMDKVLHAAHMLAAANEMTLSVAHIRMAAERASGREADAA